VPQAAYATSATLCITNGAGIQPRPPFMPALADFGLQTYCHIGP